MDTILITCLIRNNEKYIPYMIKMFDSLEKNCNYNFKYLIYTNDNNDKSLELLNQNKLSNMKIIEENLEEDILNMGRITRLYHIREKVLKLTVKETFNYLLMIDSDIFFNSNILETALFELKNTNFEVITSNTLGGDFFPFIFYYDDFSYRDLNNTTIKNTIFKKFVKFIKTTYDNNIEEVNSSFGGFFLIKKKDILKENITYLENIKENKCEHIDFNKNFKIGLVPYINPLRVSGREGDHIYKKYMDIIMKNKYDNRDDTKNILLVSLIVFIFILIILYRKFIRS